MKKLKFSHQYYKLQQLEKGTVITTIRRQLKYHIGEIVKVHLNYSYLCYAKVVNIKKKPLYKIPNDLLIQDTAPFAKNRTESIALLNTFYKNPLRETEPLYIIFLKKVDVITL